MSKYYWLLDPGHGGIIDGVYQTSGKRSPIWEDGTQLFEGEFTRDIVSRIQMKLNELNIDNQDIVNSDKDISLKRRVGIANSIHSRKRNCIYVSVHANAFKKNKGKGWEVWTSRGETKSDEYATFFFDAMKEEFSDYNTWRVDTSDGDVDKESNFYVLKNTSMPALLTENFFMTHWDDYKIISSEEGRQKIADAHVNAIMKIEGVGDYNTNLPYKCDYTE